MDYSIIDVYTDCDAVCPNGDKYESICIAYELSVIGGELFCKQYEEMLEDIKTKL